MDDHLSHKEALDDHLSHKKAWDDHLSHKKAWDDHLSRRSTTTTEVPVLLPDDDVYNSLLVKASNFVDS